MNFIKKIILGILASWLAVFVTAYYFPEYLSVTWWLRAFSVVWVIFWILNSILKPILKILSFPLILISLWVFTFLINWVIIFLTEYFVKMMPALWVWFDVKWWFFSYIIIAIVLWLTNHVILWFVDIR